MRGSRCRLVARPMHPAAGLEPLEARSLLDAITWDGGGDNATWGDALNWSTDTVPVAGDTATIDTGAGTGAIEVAGAFALDSFSSQRPLNLTSGTLTIGAPSAADAAFSVAGGTLAGAGSLTITAAMLWTSGGLTGTGAIVVQAGAAFTIDGGGTFSKPVTNAGTVTWASGAVQHNTGAFNNQAGALLRVQAGATWSGTGAFSNAGTVNKLGATTANIESAFNQSGTLAVLGGTLIVAGNGSNTGALKVFSGATLEFRGIVAHGAGAASSGAGTLLVNGGTHTFAVNTVIASRFTFGSGIVDGNGNVTFTSAVSWVGGTFSGLGDAILGASSTLTISGTIAKFLLREMVVNGTVQWTQGTLTLAGGRITTSGTVNITGNASIVGAGGVNLLAHHGTLVKTSAGTMTIGVPVQGTGAWTINAGTLTLSGGGSGSGTRFIAAGATLRFTGGYAHNGGALNGPGTVVFDGGTQTFGADVNAAGIVEFNQGVLTGPGDLFIADRLEWSGGSMSGAGFTVIRPGAELEAAGALHPRTLQRRIVNNGQFNWTSDDIRLQAGSIVNSAGKTITLSGDGNLLVTGGGGVVINFGTILKVGAAAIQFQASTTGGGGARLNNKGALQVNAGTLTLAGGVLQVISNALVEGSWSVGIGAALDIAGTSIARIGSAASVTLTGATAIFAAIGSLAVNQGTLTLANGSQLTLAPVSALFTNAGTISLGRGTMLLVAGAYTQAPGASLRVTIAGVGASNFGRVTATGAATLAGSFTVTYAGFTPAAGNTFQFLQSGSRTGQFGTTSLPPLTGLTSAVAYLTTGARLTIT